MIAFLAAVWGFQLAAGVRRATNFDLNTTLENKESILNFADPNAPIAAKLKAMKDPDYQRLWPKECTGENLLGEKVFSEPVDGFKCLKSDADKVAQPIAPEWYKQNLDKGNICCKDKCEDSLYSDCTRVDLKGASLKIINSIDKFIVDGEKIEIWRNDEVSEEDKAAGVLYQIALKIPESIVEFIESKPTLTEKGAKNLEEVIGQIAALLSLVQSATSDENENSGLLACPHGSTTACLRKEHGKGKPCQLIGKTLANLPNERAGVVADQLEKSIEGVTVGDHHGHYKFEKYTDFPGGRYGAVIIKAYDTDASDTPPTCKADDLYGFVHGPDGEVIVVDPNAKPPPKKNVCCKCASEGKYACSRSDLCSLCHEKYGGMENSTEAPMSVKCGEFANAKRTSRRQLLEMHKSCKDAF